MSAFVRMRAHLQEQGLLDDDLQLTDAGRAHTAQLLEDLRHAEAPYDPNGPTVRWDYRWRRGC